MSRLFKLVALPFRLAIRAVWLSILAGVVLVAWHVVPSGARHVAEELVLQPAAEFCVDVGDRARCWFAAKFASTPAAAPTATPPAQAAPPKERDAWRHRMDGLEDVRQRLESLANGGHR